MPGHELINKKEKKAVEKIFDNGGVLFAHGHEYKRKNIYLVRSFEKKIADYSNSKFAVAVSSGTAAIKTALKAIGVKNGDEVITQSFNFIATVEAILDCGATPIISNIDDSLNMDPNDLKKLITKKTKAIIPVHMLGFSANIDAITRIARKNKIPIIEDVCEAFGGKYKNKFLGNFGDMGIFSFDYNKTITTGEGGMIITNNKKKYKFVKEYHDHGHENNPKYARGEDTKTIYGFNYRMTEMQAAVGLEQLKKISFILKDNKKKYMALNKILSKKFTVRKIHRHSQPIFDTFIFKFKNKLQKTRILEILKEKKIPTKNLPDAIKWHFASYWDHAINKKQIKRIEKSKIFIKNYIAIAINHSIELKKYSLAASQIVNI